MLWDLIIFMDLPHARNIQTIIEQDTVVNKVMPVENQPLMIAKAVEFLREYSHNKKAIFSLLSHVSSS